MSGNLTTHEVNLRLARVQLVGVNVLVGSDELVELVCEVLAGVAHVNLHLVVIQLVYPECKHES